MMKHKLTLFIFLLLFLFSCSKNTQENTSNNLQGGLENQQYSNIEDFENIFSLDVRELVEIFPEISEDKLTTLNESVVNSDFPKVQEILPTIIEELKTQDNTSTQTIQALKYSYVSAVLNEGNYFYKEKEKSKEAIDYIEELTLNDPDFVDPFYNNYFLGYAQEIIKNYDEALKYYNIALTHAGNSEKNKKLKSIIINQIGHLYDLQGNLEEAKGMYYEAYDLNKNNYNASINIARYLARIGNMNESSKFFNYALNTPSNRLKSEIYYSLSSIELELNGLSPDINKSIEYAKLGILHNPNYPMGYVALARGYYMLNDKQYDKQIEENLNKSIEMNPSGNEAYKFYSLYYLDKKNLDKALYYLDISKKMIDYDMILMEDQRIQLKYLIDIMKVFISSSHNDIKIVFDLYKNDKLAFFIKQQLKRKEYGIYKSIKNDTKMEEIINYYSN